MNILKSCLWKVPVLLAPVLLTACAAAADSDSVDEALVDEGDLIPELRDLGTVHQAAIQGGLCPNVIWDGEGYMRYCRNHSIYAGNAAVTRAIVLVHGDLLNAKEYYDTVISIAQDEGINLSKTDVVAPHFLDKTQRDGYGLGTSYYAWKTTGTTGENNNWKYGGPTVNRGGEPSFEVMDHIVRNLVENRPNLRHIIIAGQSAGARFVSRYAAGTSEPLPAGVGITFWSANAGHYMYVDTWRPNSTSQCNNFNNYAYGFTNRNTYMSRVSAGTLRNRLFDRDIFWTSGELDTERVADVCEDTQGLNRNERFWNYRKHIFNECIESRPRTHCNALAARFIEIEGIGHGHESSFDSDLGRALLFYWD